MASSTRSSFTPRARSWASTMCARKLANKELLPEKSIQIFGNLFPARVILFLAAPNADIETDHAVLIARAHNRNIAVDVILALNNLLRTLRNVGAVGESNVIGELLLDGDLRAPRRGIRFGGQARSEEHTSELQSLRH